MTTDPTTATGQPAAIRFVALHGRSRLAPIAAASRARETATSKIGKFPVSEQPLNIEGGAFCMFIGDTPPEHADVSDALTRLCQNRDVESVVYWPGSPAAEHPHIDTFGAANAEHPLHCYDLCDAVRLGKSIASLRLEPMPRNLIEVREFVKAAHAGATSLWITGMCALDVLDAAIDGVDLREKNRLA